MRLGEVSNLLKVIAKPWAFKKHISWKNLYPDYQVELIKKVLGEQECKLSAMLILSIIRQESLFEPEAKSAANAVGLMQLTPGTASDAAQKLKLKQFSLYQEEDNLRLGIKTISDLLKKFNNRLDYALCAYNAGETATRLWIKLRGHLSPLEFIESIPFQETRLYVKNILRNHAVYQLIYASRPQSLISYNSDN